VVHFAGGGSKRGGRDTSVLEGKGWVGNSFATGESRGEEDRSINMATKRHEGENYVKYLRNSPISDRGGGKI